MPSPARPRNGLRVVALREAFKAAAGLSAGFGLLMAIRQGAAQAAEELALHRPLNPAQGDPRIFVAWAADSTNAPWRLLATGASGYAAMRVAEAFRLCYRRRWLQWFSAPTGVVCGQIEL